MLGTDPKDPKKHASSLKKTVWDQTGEASSLKIGEILRKEGHITRTQLEEALEINKKTGRRLGSVLVNLGYIDNDTILNILSYKYNYPTVSISRQSIDKKVLEIMNYELAKKYTAFPIRLDGDVLFITMTEPTNTAAIEDIQNKTKKSIKVGVSVEKDIIDAYKKHYGISDQEYEKFFAEEESEEEKVDMVELEDFGSLVSEAIEEVDEEETKIEGDHVYSHADPPMIKLVNGIIIKAIEGGMSDIHIEPFEKSIFVRYRKDGSLFKTANLPLAIKSPLVARVKILANLDIAEHRIPQDGAIRLRLGKKRVVDLRVSTLPTVYGESVVMRILDKSNLMLDMNKLGFSEAGLVKFRKAIQKPYGIILVTGPTGSGKTTALYSALQTINTVDTKILTAENPVEYNIRGINQVQVNEKTGLTFAAAMRSFLRQDPDVLMVGEIRDLETAEIAIKAAQTGHLVFSTLHTNNCPQTIMRLVDIGVPAHMVAAAVTLVVSQRLLRKICPKCRTPLQRVSIDKVRDLNLPKSQPLKAYYGKGCSHCGGSGYKGRIGIFEIMEMSEGIKEAITAELTEAQLRKIAIKEGMSTLRKEAIQKMLDGLTTIDEVLKRTTVPKESLPPYLIDPEEKTYEDGEVVMKEGNTDIDFFKLIRGCLIVTRSGQKVVEITQPGEYFGVSSRLLHQKRTETIISKGKSVVQIFPGDKLEEVLESFPEVSTKIMQSVISKLEETGDRLATSDKRIMQSVISKLEETTAEKVASSEEVEGQTDLGS